MSSRSLVRSLGLLALLAGTAAAQVPIPRVPDVRERSGLISRRTPGPLPQLPPDADRDSYLGTRYADEQDYANCLVRPYNSWRNGGMYGYPFSHACTKAVAPFFVGSPGGSICEDCRSNHPAGRRWVGNLINPWKPVGMYYDRGVYAPIYDFDWVVPGPGPFPWSHFFKHPTGG